MIDAHIHLNLKDGSPVSGLLHQMDKHGIGKAMLILNQKEDYDAFIGDVNTYKTNQDRFWIASGINIHDNSSFSRFDDLCQMGIEPKIKIHPRLFMIKKEDIELVVNSIAQYDTQIIIDTLYYGHEIEYGIKAIQYYLKAYDTVHKSLSTRYLAIKLLENDHAVDSLLTEPVREARDKAAARVQEETGTDAETAIMDAKYGFINGALTEAGYKTGTKEDTYRMTHLIDNILSNKYLGFPIFFLMLYVMFFTTFS